jgi:uncharacterized protein (TIGR02466 family)
VEIVNLFPTPVGRFNLGPLSPEEDAFVQAVGQVQVKNQGNTTSQERVILHRPEMAGLRERIDAALAEYVQTTIAPVGDVTFLPTQAWLNFTTQGQWHHRHAHAGSLISGVYYVAASGDTDRIMFFRGGYKRVPFTQAEFNPWNSDSWWIPVTAGDLVLFPSELEHMVPPVTTDSVRISLSFNTWFEGAAGSVESLTHLAVSLSGPYAGGQQVPRDAVALGG